MRQCELSAPVEQFERTIDNACLDVPLLKFGREHALWWYLAICEEILLKELSAGSQVAQAQRSACFTDHLVQTVKYPIRWIWNHCNDEGLPNRQYNDDCYSWAQSLSKLAEAYDPFETVYVYARAGYLQLDVVGGDELVCSGWLDDVCYEAYDRLFGDEDTRTETSLNLQSLGPAIERLVHVNGDRFRYGITPEFVDFSRKCMEPVERSSTRLPGSWQLPDYSLGDVHEVTSTIRCLAMIHYIARSIAARKGCESLGLRDAVLLVKTDELTRQVAEYTALSPSTVEAIVNDLTYGNCGIKTPDPALQPIIPLGKMCRAISPALWLSLDVERNFCVLANRLSRTKRAYSQLSIERSKILSQDLKRSLSEDRFRFWEGSIPGHSDLPDIDLALIDPIDRVCIVLELKSFIEPADPREIVERSQEIAKGVRQAKKLRELYAQDASVFESLLKVEKDYRFCFGVASKNSIGGAWVQDDQVPVVRASHLKRRIIEAGAARTCDWLESRSYLPIEGKHFDRVEQVVEVANQKLNWYGIRPLVSHSEF